MAAQSQSSNAERASSSARPAAAKRTRRRFLALAFGGFSLLLLVGGAALYVYRHTPPGEMPALNLDDADPDLVELVREAQAQIEHAPRSAEAWGRLAMILHANGFSSAAQVCYRYAGQLAPDDPKWPYLQGYLFHHGPGGPPTSLPYFERAARLSPDNWLLQLRLAEAELETGRLAAAAERYRGLLATNYDEGPARLGLAKVALTWGRLDEALEQLRSIEANPAVQKEAATIRASILYGQGDADAAAQERQRAERLPEDPLLPHDPVAEVAAFEVGVPMRLQVADRLLAAREIPEMLHLIQETTEKYPHSVEAWAALGNARGMLNDPVGAERALLNCVELAPHSAEHHARLAQVQVWLRQYSRAEESLRRALELDPQSATAHFALGECRQQQGDTAGAIKAYREALRLMPDHPLAKKRLDELAARP
ncbi:MAG TPA: tetratricopeptide repeat protein [Pirellulaceae bacterium]|nr:tetratricopeptide repeat protein [Pirellulaceae bacterium]